jgi:hypothetical protein
LPPRLKHREHERVGALTVLGIKGQQTEMAKSSRNPKPERPIPQFTEREIGLILKSFPAGTDPERLQKLAEHLPAWAKGELPILFRLPGRELTGEPRTQVLGVLRSAADLWKRLAALDPAARQAIFSALVPRPEERELRGFWWAKDETHSAGEALFDEVIDRLDKLIRALDRVPKHEGPGRRTNIMPLILIEHLAEMFEYVTGLKPARAIDRAPDEYAPYETGSFYDFLAAVWPVIFDSDAGLSSAFKKWAMVFKDTEWP